MVTFIQLVLRLGVLMWLCSVCRIGSYGAGLKKYRAAWESQKNETNGLTIEDAQKLLKKSGDKPNEDLKEGSKDPLERRRLLLSQALEDKNGACRLPSLHDFNELTLQEEFSRNTFTVMRIIISILLILGICGTLAGVGSLGSLKEQDIMKELPKVLEPSMWAVGGTVALVWLRGFYEYRFRKYLKELNKFTMDMLLHLQPRNLTSEDFNRKVEVFRKKMEDFEQHIRELDSISEDINKETERLKAGRVLMSQASERVRIMMDKLEQNESDLLQNAKERQSVLDGWMDGGQNSETLRTTVSFICEKEEKTRLEMERYHELAVAVDGAIQNMYGGLEDMHALADMSKELPKLVSDMKQCEATWQEIDKRRADILQATDALNNLSKKITEAESRFDAIKEQAIVKNSEAGECLENYRQEYEDYADNLKQGEESSPVKKAAIDALLQEFVKLKTDFNVEINKRLDRVGLSLSSPDKH